MKRCLALLVLFAGCAATPAVSLHREIRSHAFGERRFAHDALVTAVAFAPDGERLVTGDERGVVRVFDLEGRELERQETKGGAVQTVGILADGTIVSASPGGVHVGSKEYAARAWPGLAIGERLAAFAREDESVSVVASSAEVARIAHCLAVGSAFSARDERLAVVSSACAEIWDTRRWRRLSCHPFQRGMLLPTVGPVHAGLLDASRLWITYGVGDEYMLPVGLEDLEPQGVLESRLTLALAVGRDGSRVRLAPTVPLREVLYERGARRWRTDLSIWFPAVAISPERGRVAVASHHGVVLLDARDGHRLSRNECSARIDRIVLDGERVLAFSWDGFARVWSLSGQLCSVDILRSTDVACSPDGRCARVPCVLLRCFSERAAALSSDRRRVAVAGYRTLHVLDAVTGEQRRSWVVEQTPRAIGFAENDSALLATFENRFVRFDVATGSSIVVDEHRPIGFAATGAGLLWVDSRRHVQPADVRLDAWGDLAVFSPRGDLVALGGGTKIPVLDARTGCLLASLDGHRAPVTALTFSKDGKTLASGDETGALRLWELR